MRLGIRCALGAAILLPVTVQAQVTTVQVAARVLEPVGMTMARHATPTSPTNALQVMTRVGAPITVSLSRDLIASGFSVTLATPGSAAPTGIAPKRHVLPGDHRRVVVISHL